MTFETVIMLGSTGVLNGSAFERGFFKCSYTLGSVCLFSKRMFSLTLLLQCEFFKTLLNEMEQYGEIFVHININGRITTDIKG